LPHFLSDGIDIAYLDEGTGEPILLIHGFGSNKAVNWTSTGWVDLLKKDGRRVIALDNRGHGESEKLYRPADYHPRLMAADAANLLDHLGIQRADVMGYSMGGRIAAFLAIGQPRKVRSLILGGIAFALVEGIGREDEIIHALKAESIDDAQGDAGRAYRKFAEQTRSDRQALAACMEAQRVSLTPDDLSRIGVPALIAVGTKDRVAGSAEKLARLIPDAEVLEIPNRDHMLATGDRAFKQGVIAFLDRRP
jgi:pimeloyl-ACP methyl ester carboxylesterase